MSKSDKDGIINKILAFLGFKKPAPTATAYRLFRDPLENFTMDIPKGWKYDQDIAVMDNKYSISFTSPDGNSCFTVYVDAELPKQFDFPSYAKDQLETASAGILTTPTKGEFKGMPAYLRSYRYTLPKKAFFGGGVLFFAQILVFSLSWSGPENETKTLEPIFRHMRDSMDFESGKLLRFWRLKVQHIKDARAAFGKIKES